MFHNISNLRKEPSAIGKTIGDSLPSTLDFVFKCNRIVTLSMLIKHSMKKSMKKRKKEKSDRQTLQLERF